MKRQKLPDHCHFAHLDHINLTKGSRNCFVFVFVLLLCTVPRDYWQRNKDKKQIVHTYIKAFKNTGDNITLLTSQIQ